MNAMTATRLNLREKAIEVLLINIGINTFLRSTHNYQDERLRLCLPGNGGVLAAIANVGSRIRRINRHLAGHTEKRQMGSD